MIDGRIVWDSDTGPVGKGPSSKKSKQSPPGKKRPVGDGVARVRRETGGRKGKTVTTISDIHGSEAEIRSLAKDLKQLCGVGGSVKEGVIELQGDQRDRVVEWLEARGHAVKLAGG